MLDVGFSELLVFGIIALLVLGPEKLPEAIRSAAKWYSKFKRVINNVQNDIDRELRLSELRDQMQKEMQRIEELEQKMQTQMQELQQQSALAAEKEKQTTATESHSTCPSYHYVQFTVPAGYLPLAWLKKITHSHQELYQLPSELQNTLQLKVAV
ncbi:Sec-independent protein translocase protein TatB [Acinetobacter sp. WZC-1]|uniref:Sec-independent protein translocase protein TatB n=1 Tax=Acinetobacter sp. WZC-1 TaxID=3459034 RepID=UPI00403DBA0B